MSGVNGQGSQALGSLHYGILAQTAGSEASTGFDNALNKDESLLMDANNDASAQEDNTADSTAQPTLAKGILNYLCSALGLTDSQLSGMTKPPSANDENLPTIGLVGESEAAISAAGIDDANSVAMQNSYTNPQVGALEGQLIGSIDTYEQNATPSNANDVTFSANRFADAAENAGMPNSAAFARQMADDPEHASVLLPDFIDRTHDENRPPTEARITSGGQS